MNILPASALISLLMSSVASLSQWTSSVDGARSMDVLPTGTSIKMRVSSNTLAQGSELQLCSPDGEILKSDKDKPFSWKLTGPKQQETSLLAISTPVLIRCGTRKKFRDAQKESFVPAVASVVGGQNGYDTVQFATDSGTLTLDIKLTSPSF